ncbi:MAG: TIR domain-containing protein [Lachnospiraceae bacterium]|nr:TIR domain-containing protein [Lachnospiraceae bacterium]
MEQKYDIFISYRRDGGESTAKMIHDKLVQLGYKVFFDVESLRNGMFNVKLYSVIDECKDVVVILSPGALDRCESEEDWVRREIEYAIQKEKNVVPIMLRGFEFPEKLPESMERLPYMQGLKADLEYFDAFVKKLQSFLLSKPSSSVFSKRNVLVCASVLAAIMLVIGLTFLVRNLTSVDTGTSKQIETSASETWESDGVIYTGTKVNGVIDGYGKAEYTENSAYEPGYYEGEWKEGKLEGKGIRYWSESGDRYEGEFKDYKRNGQGIWYYSNGNRYEGEYKNDKKNGQGIYYWEESGERYEGEWKDGKRDGQGTHYYSDGSRYKGEFKDGKLNGHGTYYISNGHCYEGEFKDNKINGQGSYYDSNGFRTYEGEWKDGKKNGQGIWYSPNGDRYEGEFKDGMRHGEGTWYSGNTKFSGRWEYNQCVEKY